MSEYYLTKDELYHHGIKGQKWGNRRWQNEDGSLTPAGREHYGYGARAQYKNRVGMAKAAYKAKDKAVQDNYFKKLESIEKGYKRGQKLSEKDQKRELDLDNRAQAAWKANKEAYKAERKAAKEEYKQSDEYKARQAKLKKAAIAGAAVAATALAAYGVYKVGKLKVERANTILEGRKLCAKHAAENERKLYEQMSSYYQGEDRLFEHRPVNRLSDPYAKSLRRDMMKSQKNITKATKAYNEADKALRSNNFNKLKTAYKYAKEGSKNKKEYNNLLENASDWITRDRIKRAFYRSKDPIDISLRRISNKRH